MKTDTPRKFLIVLFAMALTAFTTAAQDKTVSFSASRMSMDRAMAEIEGQTNYKFGFERALFDTSQTVDFGGTGLTLTDALDRLAAANNAVYMVYGKTIILSPHPQPESKPAVAPRTGDRYVPGNPNGAAGTWSERPKPEPEIIPEPQPEPVAVKEYPAPYSAYTAPDLYAPMRNKLPLLAVKTNVLYGAAALTPNLSGEIGTGKRTTIEFGGSWNRFRHTGTLDDNKKLNHWIVRPEFRYWLCERFNGHFFGVHAFYSEYNVSQHNIPLLFDKKYRYEGHAYGAGITYGYHLALTRQWGIDFHVGVGVAHLKYDRFDCRLCDRPGTAESKTYFGPTRAGVSLVFLIK